MLNTTTSETEYQAALANWDQAYARFNRAMDTGPGPERAARRNLDQACARLDAARAAR